MMWAAKVPNQTQAIVSQKSNREQKVIKFAHMFLNENKFHIGFPNDILVYIDFKFTVSLKYT